MTGCSRRARRAVESSLPRRPPIGSVTPHRVIRAADYPQLKETPVIKRLAVPVSAIALAAASMAAATPAMAATAASASHARLLPGGVFKPATGLGAHASVRGGKAIEYSSNWSGYAVTGGTYTSVSATWVQNAGTCSSSDTDTDMSPWVGIDGYSSSTVEQIGTSVDCSGSSKTYYAWYEMYPANYVQISHTVSAGDKFYGSVTRSGTSYTLTLEDETAGWTYTITKTASGDANSSAEAIMEMAADELTKWSGTDPFTSFTVNGVAAGSAGTTHQMEIQDGSTLCDTTSSLSSGENFTTTWDALC